MNDYLESVTDFVSKSTPTKILLGVAAAYSGLYVITNGVIPLVTRNKNGYNSNTTAEHVVKDVDLKGTVIIVTGSNGGIGKETARVLAAKGAHVIISARNIKKLNDTKKELETEIKDAKIDAIELDLGDKDSVINFVETFKLLKVGLNYLVLNAGVMTDSYVKTKDGFESHIGINHIGHHNLTMLLLPLMKETKGEKRIVVLSSALHSSGEKKILFDDFEMEKSYVGYTPRYSHSKLANVMFANELNKKLKNDKIDITVNSVHPGIITTELHRDDGVGKKIANVFIAPLLNLVKKNIGQGAATSVFAAVHPEMEGIGGCYLSNCKIIDPLKYAENDDNCKQLWELTEKLSNEKYPF
eukprot:gene6955-11117_t